jgi:hypothetical protein
MIVCGALISIVASGGVVGEHTARVGTTTVVGAGISIPTTFGPSTYTSPAATMVVEGAFVAIVTTGGVVGKRTTGVRIASIIRATISVYAGFCCTSLTTTASAGIVDRACIAVIAPIRVCWKYAAGNRITEILGTEIAILTRQGACRQAFTSTANLVQGACVAIIAVGRVGDGDTSLNRGAAVDGTNVSVITIERSTRAGPFTACIFEGADTVVVARFSGQGNQGATFRKIAYRIFAGGSLRTERIECLIDASGARDAFVHGA